MDLINIDTVIIKFIPSSLQRISKMQFESSWNVFLFCVVTFFLQVQQRFSSSSMYYVKNNDNNFQNAVWRPL